jgi:hypothetical protein
MRELCGAKYFATQSAIVSRANYLSSSGIRSKVGNGGRAQCSKAHGALDNGHSAKWETLDAAYLRGS